MRNSHNSLRIKPKYIFFPFVCLFVCFCLYSTHPQINKVPLKRFGHFDSQGKAYTVYSGRCFVSPIEDDDVFNSEELKSLTFDTKGKLGMKGTMVGVYGGIVNGGK